ncbi:CaiB/BaiF CoA transferase family protein [Actinoplanes sp. CA-142083]|uniref:CaiB/BaiF CoA transferase family protein n=1 Tax=Actinoplanes sp. CA-142083 TaxID=3239903 RepID=UPI003D8B920F
MPPLSGVRVLDLTNVLAGPYCSYHLMLLGAEVVKIEVPGVGDLARRLGPDPALNRDGMGSSFLAQNAGKKSVELNLKESADRETFEQLASSADVLLENFRAGVLARLGYGWDRLRELNPGLVYCAISGFGQDGPLSQGPAYDQVVQGLSGMMSITGTPETAPLRVGFPVCDTVGGLSAALAIVAALHGRQRDGEGRFLDVSMLETSISAMGWPVSNYLVCGVPPEPMGDQNATAAPSGTFEAADGPLNISANRQEQFVTLCGLLDRADLLDDPRFAEREARKEHRAELNRELNKSLGSRTAAEWEAMLSAAGVPAARILTVPEAIDLPQLDERGFLTPLGDFRVTGSGVLVDGEPLRPPAPPPTLGQHNDEVPALIARWQS